MSSKSCSLDPLPTFLLKDCVDILLPSLTKLVNASLSEGLFPDDFKKAIVTPLIKKSSLPKMISRVIDLSQASVLYRNLLNALLQCS